MTVCPAPSTPADTAGRGPRARVVVRHGVPGDRPTWSTRSARISGLLVALADAEAGGLVLPAPVAGRRALRAWARTAEPLLAAGGPRGDVPVDLDDLELVGAAGRALARVLCRDRERLRGPGPPGPAGPDRTAGAARSGSPDRLPGPDRLADVLHAEARARDLPAEQLVAELGRAARLLAPRTPSPPVPVPVPTRASAAG